MEVPVLSVLIWLPIFGGGFVLATENVKQLDSRKISCLIIFFTLLLSASLYMGYVQSEKIWQFREIIQWIPQMGINYELGVDGISILFVNLVCFMTFVTIIATWNSISHNLNQYIASLLVLQGLLVGVFASLNSILFYIFWEATLIPMYLIIGIWGSGNRIYAARKFFIFTFFGSALFLAALIYLGILNRDFSILNFYYLKLGMFTQIIIFVAFLLGFAIKIPMWPVHTWLPHAHTEAPAGGSVILAAVLLKMGAYGFLRFSLPIVPDACLFFAWPMIILSLIAIIYIALVALAQNDLKRLIAYSSVSHMGFVTLGCFIIFVIYGESISAKVLGLEGAIIIMLSHGFISGALFIGIGFIYDRLHTRSILELRGIVNSMPIFASFFMLFALANIGVPGTSGFVGEFMIILSALQANVWIAFFAATTLFLSAAYTLWMYKRVIFGEPKGDSITALADIHGMELFAFVLLAVMVLWIGIYPAPIIEVMHTSIGNLLHIASTSRVG
ncbi:MAG: NADH-quinone oxidoreductase subunit M [Legionellales bacterium]|nr:NADH-quinone oxidoreductase subunit M [Legionellales bacterium]